MKSATAPQCLAAHKHAVRGFDTRLKKILAQRAKGPAASMYRMLQYFMGFLDEDFRPLPAGTGGKRFRPSLCLFIAEAYGVREKAMDVALAIELFHNFTLIHDDVEDRDEVRRNRPTQCWSVATHFVPVFHVIVY